MQRKPKRVVVIRLWGKTVRKPKSKKLIRTKADRFISLHRSH